MKKWAQYFVLFHTFDISQKYATCNYAYVNVRYKYNSAYVRHSLCIRLKNASDTLGIRLVYADKSIRYVTSGISYE